MGRSAKIVRMQAFEKQRRNDKGQEWKASKWKEARQKEKREKQAKGSQDPDGEVTMSGVEAAAGGIPGITLSAADRARAAAGAALLQKAAAAEGPRKKYSTHRLELGGRASIELITRGRTLRLTQAARTPR
ncbi:unnamed protein product [Prorocentrum cordatum]|uniref:Ribosome biogenesis protein NOP53 n=1 Tax=Prorocentrum cordatum TaxID=2364126 RepID=A0ABN9RWG2_9DINO|nr:unnamed protein product [Polarella glacialis]